MVIMIFKRIYLLIFIMVAIKPIAISQTSCLSGPCIHGVCVDTEKDSYRCYCINGYTGLNCQTNYDDCKSMPCQHGANCTDGIASFSCSCVEGYTGHSCEVNINECLSAPCLNGGICHDEINGYRCECLPGYRGIHCEEDLNVCRPSETNDTQCLNGGTCIEGPGFEYSCSCLPGFTGFHCEEELNECASSPCLNNGVCINGINNFSCICPFGWTGKICETEVRECEENLCKNGGICLIEMHADGVNKSRCYCVPDYHGNFCERRYNECLYLPEFPCLNGGSCVDGVDSFSCLCPQGFTGKFCENICTSTICDIDRTMDLSVQFYTSPVTYDFIRTIPSTVIQEMSATSFLDISSYISFSFVISDLVTLISNILTAIISSPSTMTDMSSFVRTPESTYWVSSWTFFDISETITTKFSSSLISYSLQSNVSLVESEKYIDSTIREYDFSTVSTEQVDMLSLTSSDIIYSSEFTLQSETVATIVIDETKVLTSEVSKTEISIQSTESEFEIFTDTSYPFLASTEFSLQSPYVSADSHSLYTILSSINESEIIKSSFVLVSTDILPISTTSILEPSLFISDSTSFEDSSWPLSNMTTEILYNSTISTIVLPMETFSEISTSAFHSIDLSSLPVQTVVVSDITEITYPLSITENITDLPFFNCKDIICENGGTPVKSSDESIDSCECLCPLNVTGPRCEEEIFVEIPQFSKRSFLRHTLPDISLQQELAISFAFKTKFSKGLILYTESSEDKSFILLHVDIGLLKLNFSCGQQTMVFSESSMKVNHGFYTTVSFSLEIKQDTVSRTCSCTLSVNNSAAMSGQQLLINPKIQFKYLYFGGFPLNYKSTQSNADEITFFSGCMKDLNVNGKERKLVNDAVDGADIIKCDRITCAHQPCLNGGTCVSDGKNWYCICKVGYIGTMCEHTTCDANPCKNGGTCLSPIETTNYICLCPYGYHDRNCEQILNISRPSFHGHIFGYSSFIQYFNIINPQHYLDVKLKFTTKEVLQKGLILFMGQHDVNDPMTDCMAIGLENGFFTYYINLGSGFRKLQSAAALDSTVPVHEVHIGHHKRYVWLTVDNQRKVIGMAPEKLNALNVLPYIFIGGHSAYNFSILPFPINQWNGFKGCIFDMKLRNSPENLYVDLSDIRMGRNVQQCHKNECELITCENGGTCITLGTTFKCVCAAGWIGPRCTEVATPCNDGSHHCAVNSTCVVLNNGYRCDCMLGQTGIYCNETVIITNPQFNSFNSFMEYKYQNVRQKTEIKIEFKPTANNGILFYASQKKNDNNGDFAAIIINHGHVQFRYNLGTGLNTTTNLQNPLIVALDNWYTVVVRRHERVAHLRVNDTEITDHSPSGMTALDINSNFFLGGLPDPSLIIKEAVGGVFTSFVGCVNWFEVNGKVYDLSTKDAVDGRNINNCDDTLCEYNTCQNGGMCSQHPDGGFFCNCSSEYTGSVCDTPVLCLNHNCQNGATCISNISNKTYLCDCPLGWTGSNCEIASDISAARFKDNSHLYFWDKNYKKEDLTETHVSFKFASSIYSGLLFWNGKVSRNDDYLGIGLEKGHLKIVWNLGWLSHSKITTNEDYFADRRWHSVSIDRYKQKLILRIDNKKYENQVAGDYFELNTNGHYYFGGFPRNINIKKETNGHFTDPFDGCIGNIILPYSSNFSDIINSQSSTNITSCNTAMF